MVLSSKSSNMKVLVRPLNPELAKHAEVELNETPKKLEDGIRHLKEWIAKQPHLRARTDDQWLTAFLRGCKHSLERAKEKLDLYYSLRTVTPELFAFRQRDPRFKELLKTGCVLILPKLSSPEDPRSLIIRPGLYDPNKFSTCDFISFSHIIQQILYLEDDAFLVNGTNNFIDFEGVTMTHILQMTPVQMKKLVVAGQDASPLRLKTIHYFNCSSIIEKVFNIAMKLIHEKLKNRMFMHRQDMSKMSQFVSKDILPTEFGGNGGTTQEIIEHWLKKMDEYGPWLDEDMTYGTDESLRPGKPKNAGTMFGIEGSFRSLEVD